MTVNRKIVFVDGQPYWLCESISGGMGKVFLLEKVEPSQSLVYRQFLAAKTFLPGIERLSIRRELTNWLTLSHPNILPLCKIGTIDDELAALSPWRRFGTLEGATFSQEQSSVLHGIASCLLDALEYAWAQHSMLHLDIKPSNVFVKGDPIQLNLGTGAFPA